jgi:ketosteroid isomerase-like protein
MLDDAASAELQRLIDKDQIRDLLYKYSLYSDSNDKEALADLFVEDCVIDYGPQLGKREGRASFFTKRISPVKIHHTSHHNANILITFDGPDRATVISSLYAWHNLDGYPNGEVWGQYHDVVVRTPDGWLIESRTIKNAGARDFPAGPDGHYMVDWKED